MRHYSVGGYTRISKRAAARACLSHDLALRVLFSYTAL